MKRRVEILYCTVFQTGSLFHKIGNIIASTSVGTETVLKWHCGMFLRFMFSDDMHVRRANG